MSSVRLLWRAANWTGRDNLPENNKSISCLLPTLSFMTERSEATKRERMSPSHDHMPARSARILWQWPGSMCWSCKSLAVHRPSPSFLTSNWAVGQILLPYEALIVRIHAFLLW